MNAANLRSANAICGRIESLQKKLAPKYGEAGRQSECKRRAYEAARDAKIRMMDAIRAMEDAK